MKNKRILLAVFGLIVISLLLVVYANRAQSRINIYEYLPELRKCNVYDLKFEQIHADPSFVMPYNILISFKEDRQNIPNILALRNLSEIDTLALKDRSWPEEYRMYFTMNSLNATRSKAIQEAQNAVKWWRVENCSNNYASPYLDNGKKGVAHFGEIKNGRIVCCKNDHIYYILIECWG